MKKLLIFIGLSVFLSASLITGKLQNGISYYILKNAVPKNSAYLSLVVKAGSVEENASQLGFAHFVEHMVFNSSKDFKKDELTKTLEALGLNFGADLNAYTAFTQTVYFLNIPSSKENMKTAMKVFRNYADGALFIKDEVEKEKGIIVEESRLRNSAWFEMFTQQQKYLFKNSAYENRFPIGDMNLVRAAKPQDLRDYYDKWYRPELMSIVAVGDFDEKHLESLIKTQFKSMKAKSKAPKPNTKIPTTKRFDILRLSSKDLTRNSIELILTDKISPKKTKQDYKEALKNEIIFRLFSILNAKMSKEAKVEIDFFTKNQSNNAIFYIIEARVLNNDFNKSIDAIKLQIARLKKFGFTKHDVNLAKNDLLKSIEQDYKNYPSLSSEEKSGIILQDILLGEKLLSPKERLELLSSAAKEISTKEINDKFKKIATLEDKLLTIKAIDKSLIPDDKFIKSPIKTALKPFEIGKKLPSSILAKAPKKGKINQTKQKDNNITELSLANGSKVVIKPISAIKNEIFINVIKQGGLSALHENDIHQAAFAIKVANDSGVGEFSNTQTLEILSDKNIDINYAISNYSSNLSLKTSPKDLEEALKFAFLSLKSPVITPSVFNNEKLKFLDFLANINKNPLSHFYIDFSKFLYPNDKRMQELPSIKEAQNFTLQKSQDLLNKAFANGEYLFVIVGDVNAKTLEPLVKTYIASLPKGQKTNYKVFKHKQTDKQYFKKNYNTKDVANTIFISTDPLSKVDYKHFVKLATLKEIFNVLLREDLREKKSIIYGTRAGLEIDIPSKKQELSLSFTLSPSNVDTLIKQVFAIANNMKNGKIEPEYLENYKKQTIINYKKDFENENFWISNIIKSYIFGIKIYNPKEYETLVNSISLKEIKQTAKAMFANFDKSKVGILDKKP